MPLIMSLQHNVGNVNCTCAQGPRGKDAFRIRVSLDWVLTAVLTAVLCAPTLLTPDPDRLLACMLQRHVHKYFSPVLLERSMSQ